MRLNESKHNGAGATGSFPQILRVIDWNSDQSPKFRLEIPSTRELLQFGQAMNYLLTNAIPMSRIPVIYVGQLFLVPFHSAIYPTETFLPVYSPS